MGHSDGDVIPPHETADLLCVLFVHPGLEVGPGESRAEGGRLWRRGGRGQRGDIGRRGGRI